MFKRKKPESAPIKQSPETQFQKPLDPVVRLRDLLKTTYIDKGDLADMLERVDYLPPQFLVFANKFWEQGSGRDLVVKYLGVLRNDETLSTGQKESAYLAIIRLLETLQTQNRIFREAQEGRDPRQDRERTVEFLVARIKRLPKSARRVEEFLGSWSHLSTESTVVSRRTQEWVRSRDISVVELEEWYPRVRNLLLLRGDKSGVAWLDRQLLAYLQKNGEGLGIV